MFQSLMGGGSKEKKSRDKSRDSKSDESRPSNGSPTVTNPNDDSPSMRRTQNFVPMIYAPSSTLETLEGNSSTTSQLKSKSASSMTPMTKKRTEKLHKRILQKDGSMLGVVTTVTQTKEYRDLGKTFCVYSGNGTVTVLDPCAAVISHLNDILRIPAQYTFLLKIVYGGRKWPKNPSGGYQNHFGAILRHF